MIFRDNTQFQEQAILEEIQEVAKQSGSLASKETRFRLLQLSEQLSASLRAPEDVANEVAYYPMYAFAVRIAIDLNLFELIDAKSPSIDAAELAAASGGSQDLITRILRVVSALKFVDEVGENQWASNEITKVMCRPEAYAAHIHKWTNCNGTMVKMPAYLKKIGYETPTDPSNGPFQYAFETEKSAFDYWNDRPEIIANFNTFMKGKRASRPSWAEWWPVDSLLLQPGDLDSEKVLVVDVGGGRGHDIEGFRNKFPNRGRLVLEDQPSVIADIQELHADIERVGHNFFTAQPIIGARIYFFGMIFHDWSDEFCLKILEQTVPAMTKGYSKILIDDAVLPVEGCPAVLGGLDLAMMAMHSGKERTERQWHNLLQQAGLKINKFWPYNTSGTGIIEAELN